jgi:hypothetical protein
MPTPKDATTNGAVGICRVTRVAKMNRQWVVMSKESCMADRPTLEAGDQLTLTLLRLFAAGSSIAAYRAGYTPEQDVANVSLWDSDRLIRAKVQQDAISSCLTHDVEKVEEHHANIDRGAGIDSNQLLQEELVPEWRLIRRKCKGVPCTRTFASECSALATLHTNQWSLDFVRTPGRCIKCCWPCVHPEIAVQRHTSGPHPQMLPTKRRARH